MLRNRLLNLIQLLISFRYFRSNLHADRVYQGTRRSKCVKLLEFQLTKNKKFYIPTGSIDDRIDISLESESLNDSLRFSSTTPYIHLSTLTRSIKNQKDLTRPKLEKPIIINTYIFFSINQLITHLPIHIEDNYTKVIFPKLRLDKRDLQTPFNIIYLRSSFEELETNRCIITHPKSSEIIFTVPGFKKIIGIRELLNPMREYIDREQILHYLYQPEGECGKLIRERY